MPRHPRLPSSEITPLSTYLRRRDFLALGAAGAGALLFGGRASLAAAKEQHGAKLPSVKKSSYTVSDKQTPFADITNYNNFYEFGTDKDDPAPIRLVVPWKYGFKGIKSIVKIHLQETQPQTTWSQYGGGVEYGFYANVNPEVDHPRWSQAKERRIGEVFRRATLMFNGYPEVSKLYAGMDLRKFY